LDPKLVSASVLIRALYFSCIALVPLQFKEEAHYFYILCYIASTVGSIVGFLLVRHLGRWIYWSASILTLASIPLLPESVEIIAFATGLVNPLLVPLAIEEREVTYTYSAFSIGIGLSALTISKTGVEVLGILYSLSLFLLRPPTVTENRILPRALDKDILLLAFSNFSTSAVFSLVILFGFSRISEVAVPVFYFIIAISRLFFELELKVSMALITLLSPLLFVLPKPINLFVLIAVGVAYAQAHPRIAELVGRKENRLFSANAVFSGEFGGNVIFPLISSYSLYLALGLAEAALIGSAYLNFRFSLEGRGGKPTIRRNS